MNTKRLFKLMVCVFFIGLSGVVHAEDDQLDDVVFTFMRKSQVLPDLFVFAGKLEGGYEKQDMLRDAEQQVVINGLPFRKLYRQLDEESKKLVDETKSSFFEKNGKLGEAKYKEMMEQVNSLVELETFEAIVRKLKEITKELDILAMVEALQIEMAKTYDLTKAIEEFLKTKGIENLSLGNLDKNQLAALMIPLFDEKVQEYMIFVEQNRDILESVAAFADNEFKMEIQLERCGTGTFKGRKVCTVSTDEVRIKVLSEIMPYIYDKKANKKWDKAKLYKELDRDDVPYKKQL